MEKQRESEARRWRVAQHDWQRYVELGRRAAATPGWRWMPGMEAIGGMRVVSVDRDGYALAATSPERGYPQVMELPLDAVPALGDRATQGCVRQVLQGLYPQDHVWFAPCGSRWLVYYRHDCKQRVKEGWSLAEAMVLALEARGEPDGDVLEEDDGA